MSGAMEAIRGFVRNRAGISLGADKDYLVISRLEPRLSGWHLPSLDKLAERLRSQPTGSLANDVVAALTTNETLWFRDGKPFEALRAVILPDLLCRRDAGRQQSARRLAIWSAACATGQEVYSIAMTLQDTAAVRDCQVSILGSDICEPAVARARSGRYTQFEVQRGLSIQHLVRYFEQNGNDWCVRPELRAGVAFRTLNLLDLPAGLGPFDAVFCRNVLIYFDIDVKCQVLAAIAARLRPGGYLVLGGAETTLGLASPFASVPDTTGVYRKVR
jgi:chemotaxis protein methyltransferase CheR